MTERDGDNAVSEVLVHGIMASKMFKRVAWIKYHKSRLPVAGVPRPRFEVKHITHTSVTMHIEGQVCHPGDGRVFRTLVYIGSDDCKQGTTIH